MTAKVIAVQTPSDRQALAWRAARIAALLLTVTLPIALVIYPAITLNAFWNVIIPILPAVFLINPLLWRNVCPLATLNKATGRRIGRRHLSPTAVTVAGTIGVLLLYLLVPARRFLFNTNGVALAFTIVIVGLLAVACGVIYNGRAGFCNAICPVLPVEKLYGQSPLVRIDNARCAHCDLCTSRGCVDLAPTKSIAQTIGPARRTKGWILTPFGTFAASFPGFVAGYFTTPDGPVATGLSVYAHIFSWAAASFVLFGLAGLIRPGNNQQLVAIAGALALVLYYWFVAPQIAVAVSLPQGGTLLRVASLALVLAWLARGGVWAGGEVAAGARPDPLPRV